LLLNARVSHTVSRRIWGRRTGCVEGHGPPDSNVPDDGYATCSRWFGESRFTPSQHVLYHISFPRAFNIVAWQETYGNRWLIIIPIGHGCFGNSSVSGSLVPSFCMQMYVNCLKSLAPSRSLLATSPTSMRKPGLKAVTLLAWAVSKSASVM
jgi:hypothetical protein